MKLKTILLLSIFSVAVYVTAFGTSTIVSWMKDMYNQKSIKPQEEGTMQEFPLGVVSTKGFMRSAPLTEAQFAALENNPKTKLHNPKKSTASSIKNGEFLFNTYCTVCHGSGGMGGAPIQTKGMPSLPIRFMVGARSDGYLFYMMTYGRGLMPSLNHSITAEERWDILNYIRSWEN